MSSSEDVARQLGALAATTSQDENGQAIQYFMDWQEGSLNEGSWNIDESCYGLAKIITEDAAPGTGASYVVVPEIRFAFFVDNHYYLQQASYRLPEGDEEESEWEEGDLSEQKIQTHPNSQISASALPDGFGLVYQDDNNNIVFLMYGFDTKTIVSKKALPGTPLQLFDTAAGAYVFYSHQDQSIHYAYRKTGSDNWEDVQYNNTTFDGQVVVRIFTTASGSVPTKGKEQEDQQEETYQKPTSGLPDIQLLLGNGQLFVVSNTGAQQLLGTFEGETFEFENAAQSFNPFGFGFGGNTSMGNKYNYQFKPHLNYHPQFTFTHKTVCCIC